MTIKRYQVEALAYPVDGYTHMVKTLTSVDGGRSFYYCGNSRYFRAKQEAEEHARAKEAEQ